jgi:PhnB protein
MTAILDNTALAAGGETLMPLGKTFFSDYYGMVRGRYGITWQLSATPLQ